MIKLKILWHWTAMGPYHFARMSALALEPGVELVVIETSAVDDHGWKRSNTKSYPFELITLSGQPLSKIIYKQTSDRYLDVLKRIEPDVVVQSGYAEPHYRKALFKYKRLNPGVLALFWSETTAVDHKRFWLAEKYKSFILSHFDGALVAGIPHLRYILDLGMPSGAVTAIGGTVDNEFFSTRAAQLRASSTKARRVAAPYFLYVGRLIPAKNLLFLLRAFHLYRVMSPGLAHDLVLVGSGTQEEELRALVRDLRIDGVHFAGNQQLEELPPWYTFASAFVLPSTSEPWGLVINEAMASSLPVLASSACGAAEDLVFPGETGLLFDPHKTEDLAQCFHRIAANPEGSKTMGGLGRQRISMFSMEQYTSRITRHIRNLREESVQRSRLPGLLMGTLGSLERALS